PARTVVPSTTPPCCRNVRREMPESLAGICILPMDWHVCLSLVLAQTAYALSRTSGPTTWSRVRSDPGYCAHLCLPAIDAVVGAELLVCPRRYSGLSVLRASRPLL